MKRCPRCGSKNVAEILYGMPAYDEELQKKLDKGMIVLGGCCINSADINGEQVNVMPSMHCNDCKKDFGKPPILISRKSGEAEDYRDIVTSIYFSVGGFFQGDDVVSISRNRDGAVVTAGRLPGDTNNFEKRQIATSEWKQIIDVLYTQLYLQDWKRRYVDPNTLDGTQWELKIRLTGGRRRDYYGSNVFPPYWKELEKVFQKYTVESMLTPIEKD